MWIFLNNAFLSIVDKGGDGRELLVRARHSGDIERIFPGANVQMGGGTDYLYRAFINREQVADAIANAIRAIDYQNFKNTVNERERHNAYMHVWSDMYDFQRHYDSPDNS